MNREFVKVLGSNFQTEEGGEKSSRLGHPTWLSESGFMCVDPQSCRRPVGDPREAIFNGPGKRPIAYRCGGRVQKISKERSSPSPNSLVRRWLTPLC